jgi:hypothetical protein
MARGQPQSKVLAEIERRLKADEVLSPEEKDAIRAKAAAHVKKNRRTATEEALLHAYIKEEERADKPAEELVDIILDLPEHAPFIRLDNRVWFHGVLYEVEMGVYQTMMDVQGRMWEHEKQTEGKAKFNRPRQMNISPSRPQGNVTTTANVRG